MNESSHLFTELQPPPGGLQRLQQTIHLPATSNSRTGWWLGAGAFATLFLLLSSLLPELLTRHRQTTELISAMRAAMAPPAHGIHVVDGAAIELPSGQANVRLYLVQSAAPVDRAGPR